MSKKNILKKNILLFPTLISGFLLVIPFASTAHASTTPQGSRDQVCVGLGGCPDAEAGVQGIVDDALNIISIIIGIAGVVMVMIGGFKYITAGGDSGKIASAQNTIIWAIVGLIVAALSQILVRFVLNAVPNP